MLVWLLAADRADATTCIYSPSTLADSYANARGVVVAQVTGCAGIEYDDDGNVARIDAHRVDGLMPPGRDLSIETRTTQISAEASEFLACVDGSLRRPPPDGL